MNGTLKQVTGYDGQVFQVDTSSEACAKFGFAPGQKIADPYNRKGVVVGVAPLPEKSACLEKGTDVLFILLDELNGKVCFFPEPAKNLRKL